MPEQVGFIVVGAGLAGLTAARAIADAGRTDADDDLKFFKVR